MFCRLYSSYKISNRETDYRDFCQLKRISLHSLVVCHWSVTMHVMISNVAQWPRSCCRSLYLGLVTFSAVVCSFARDSALCVGKVATSLPRWLLFLKSQQFETWSIHTLIELSFSRVLVLAEIYISVSTVKMAKLSVGYGVFLNILLINAAKRENVVTVGTTTRPGFTRKESIGKIWPIHIFFLFFFFLIIRPQTLAG